MKFIELWQDSCSDGLCRLTVIKQSIYESLINPDARFLKPLGKMGSLPLFLFVFIVAAPLRLETSYYRPPSPQSTIALGDFGLVIMVQIDVPPNAGTRPMPATNLRQPALVCLLFFSVGVGLHVVTPTLNGLNMMGIPAGYWVSAQGGPVVLALLLGMLRSRKIPA